MKEYWCIFLLAIAFDSYGQNEATFKVVANKDITFLPDVDTLLADKKYFFEVKEHHAKYIADTKFNGGKVTVSDSGIWIETSHVTSVNKCTLVLYTREGGILKEAFRKNFTVLPAASPEIPSFFLQRRIADIGFDMFPQPNSHQDSATKSAYQLRLSALLSTIYPRSFSKSKLDYSLRVTIKCGDNVENYILKNWLLSDPVWDEANKLEKGCELVVDEIKYHSFHDPPDDVVKGPYTLVVNQ